jgi:hypothetical protein
MRKLYFHICVLSILSLYVHRVCLKGIFSVTVSQGEGLEPSMLLKVRQYLRPLRHIMNCKTHVKIGRVNEPYYFNGGRSLYSVRWDRVFQIVDRDTLEICETEAGEGHREGRQKRQIRRCTLKEASML